MTGIRTRVDRWLETTTLRLASGFRHTVGLGRTCPLHAHQTIELVYHPTGRGHTDLRGGQRRTFVEGDLIVYAPGAMHDQTMTRAGEDWCVHIASPTGWPMPERTCLCLATTQTMRSDLEALSAGVPAEQSPARRAFDARATALLLDVLQQASADAVPEPPATYASRARELVMRDYASITDIATVATALGISGDYLRHLFRAEYGQSLGQFLIETRLQRAREMLRFTRVPLKTIVVACGFANDRYFCTAFRRRFGCTPTDFRKHDSARPLLSRRRRRGASGDA